MSNEDIKAALIGKRFPVLDDGWIELRDCMGSDADICDAARRSYGKGTRSVSDDETLIRYMLRHHHGTPFEMAEIKLAVRIPNGDTWRQMIRHRAAPILDESSMFCEPSVNAYSYRYSEADLAFQKTPEDAWRLQSASNKQGSAGRLESWTGPAGRPNPDNSNPEYALDHAARVTGKVPMDVPLSPGGALSILEADFHREARQLYEQRIAMGVAREQARKDLPNSLYTEAYWKCDLRNVLHFLSLRMDEHAQEEIREYAKVIGREIIAVLFPITWRAFERYVLGAMTLSVADITAVRLIVGSGLTGPDIDKALEFHFANGRERDECRAKIRRLGLGRRTTTAEGVQ